MVAKKKSAGGSLTRSQVVTVRLDPKLKFAAELAARKQRRTISSFIEWAVEQAIERVEIVPRNINDEGDTVSEAVMNVWDVEEADRVAKLAIYYPHLLSYEEEQIWKIVKEFEPFWKNPGIQIGDCKLNIELLRHNWETLHKIISGEASKADLSEIPS